MKRWTPENVALAERVPVWTRPVQPSFSGGGGFAAWGSAEPELAVPVDPVPDFVPPQVDAFAQGFAEGYAAGEAALADEHDALRALAEGLQALRPEPPADLARLLATTVSRLVTQIVGEVALDEAVIAHRAEAVAQLIAAENAPTRLRVSPDDATRLATAALPVELVADAALQPGNVLLETAGGWVEDGPAIRMERLRAALDQLAATR